MRMATGMFTVLISRSAMICMPLPVTLPKAMPTAMQSSTQAVRYFSKKPMVGVESLIV